VQYDIVACVVILVNVGVPICCLGGVLFDEDLTFLIGGGPFLGLRVGFKAGG